jgi:hypothetical protein
MDAGRKLLTSLFIVSIMLIFLVSFMPRVYSADDSNSGQLAQSQTLNNQQLNSTLNALSLNLNNSEAKQLMSQLQTQMASNDTSGEAATLAQLKQVASTNSSGMSSSLQDLLKSLYVGNTGLTVDPNLLASSLGNTNSNGMPSGLASESPQQAASDLQTLASLLQGIDPSLSQQFSSDASMINQGQAQTGSNETLPIPKSAGLPVPQPPALSTPALSTPAIIKFPTMSLVLMIVGPIIIISAGLAIFFSRSRLGTLLGSRVSPNGTTIEDTTMPEFLPNDPKGRIIYFFHKTVQIMRLRGVSKLTSETHREFNAKCSNRIEGPNVSRVSGLYEKAKFSGQDIVSSEADEAARNLANIEQGVKPSN